MQNYRNKNNQHHRAHARQAIDGFISAPKRESLLTPQPARKPVFQDRLRNAEASPRSSAQGQAKRIDGWQTIDRAKPRQLFGSDAPHSEARKPQPQVKPAAQPLRKQFNDEPEEPKTKRGGLFMRRRNERRAGRKRGLSRRQKFVRVSAGAFVVLLLGFGLFSYLNLSKIFQGGGAAVALDADVDPSKLRGEGDGRVNILLLGRGGVGHDGPDLTDTILVASIDPVNKKAALISIPRDMWVEGRYSESKINAVFANAKNAALADGVKEAQAERQGVRATEKVVENILGINMHYYGMIDFKGFEKMVNTVNGVTINVPEELRDSTMAWENNWNPVIAKKGVQKMKGKQALMYVRSRYTSNRGDFDRAERQRLFITALKNEIMSAGTFGNPVKVSKLMKDFGDSAKTDFSLNDLMRLYNLSKDIKTIDSIGLVDEPHDYLTTDNYGGQSVVVPKDGVFNYDAIRMYVRKSLPDGYIVRENAPIVLLNGSGTEGIAQAKAEELRSYSYNVKKVENAPSQDYAKTIIVDLTGDNKYTQNYLERRFGVKAVTKLPDGIEIPKEERQGFVIIIGENETINR